MAQYELVRFLSGVRLVCYVAVEDEREREVEGGERSKCFFCCLRHMFHARAAATARQS